MITETVISLLFQCFSLIAGVYIAFAKYKNIYIISFLFNFAHLLLYILTDEKAAIVTYSIISIRSFIFCFYRNNKNLALPAFFSSMHIIFGFLTLTSPIQVITIITPCITTFNSYMSENEKQIRIGNIVTNSLWAFYNLTLGLYILIIMRLIVISANIISILIEKK